MIVRKYISLLLYSYHMQQLGFQFSWDQDSLRDFLEHRSRRKVRLVMTDNSTSMISVRTADDVTLLRLHRIFFDADTAVISEIALFLRNYRRRTPLVREFINRNQHRLKRRFFRRMTMRPQGRHYNLMEIFDAVNREYFHGEVSARVTWGLRGPVRSARRRTLGSYSADTNVIRIHPILDSRRVPRYYLEFIMYHEMLHAWMGIANTPVRRSIHSRAFRLRERMFKHYERAIAWEQKRFG